MTSPNLPCSDAGMARPRTDARAELGSRLVVNSDYKGKRSQTQEHVPLVTLRSLSEVLPVNPASCSQTPITPQGSRKRSNSRTQPHVQSAVATSVSLNRRGCEPDGRTTGSNPTRKSRGKRGGGIKAKAVSAASGPRRSKRVALINGRTSNIPRASQPPHIDVLVSPRGACDAPLSHTLMMSASHSRWNGCGCRDVFWWSPELAHRRRGPRSGHLTLIKNAPAAHQPRPHACSLRGRS